MVPNHSRPAGSALRVVAAQRLGAGAGARRTGSSSPTTRRPRRPALGPVGQQQHQSAALAGDGRAHVAGRGQLAGPAGQRPATAPGGPARRPSTPGRSGRRSAGPSPRVQTRSSKISIRISCRTGLGKDHAATRTHTGGLTMIAKLKTVVIDAPDIAGAVRLLRRARRLHRGVRGRRVDHARRPGRLAARPAARARPHPAAVARPGAPAAVPPRPVRAGPRGRGRSRRRSWGPGGWAAASGG